MLSIEILGKYIFLIGLIAIGLFVLLPARFTLSKGTIQTRKSYTLGGGAMLGFKKHMLTPMGRKLRLSGHVLIAIGMLLLLVNEWRIS